MSVLTVRSWVLGGLLAGFTLSLSLTRIHSLDYWWHLRIGRWIVENGRVPHVDVFSYTAAGAPYLDVHWLHQVVLHGVHALGGHEAVVLWQGVLALGLAAILWGGAHGRGRPEWTALVVAVAVWLASVRFMPRPELPTFVLLAAVLALLERDRRRGGDTRALWLVVPLQLVWANVHGLYVLGIAACALHLAGELAAPLWRAAVDRRRVARLAGVAAASLAVTLVNPNGVDLLLYPWIQLGMISERSGAEAPWVVEIGRLFGSSAHPTSRLVTLGLAVATAGAMLLNRRRVAASHVLLWGAFCFLTLGAHRNQALLAIVAAPILLASWNDWLDAQPAAPRLSRAATAGVALLLVLGTVDGVRGELRGRISDRVRFGLGVAEGLQPVGAVDWIEEHRPPGRIFHAMSDGGYLIHRLHPDYPVMLDGRLEVYGRRAFQRLNVGGPAAFRRIARELGVRTALLTYRSQPFDALLAALVEDPDWTLVFVDDVAAVFVRADAGFAPLDPRAGDPFARLPDDAPHFLRPRVLARVRFDLAVGEAERGLARWRRYLAAHPEETDEPLLHVGLLLQAGRRAEASALLGQAVAERDDDATFLAEAADVRAALGDVAGAEALRARARRLSPAGPPGSGADPGARAALETAVLAAAVVGLGGAVVRARRRSRRGPSRAPDPA